MGGRAACSPPADDGRRRCSTPRPADYQAGQAIVREQDRSDFVAVIVEGRVCISRYVGSGREAMMAIRRPGELVGEISALLDDVDGRSATVVALDPVRAHLLPGPGSSTSSHREPAVMFAVLRHLAHRLRGESARVEVSTGSSTRRVARLLVQRSVDAASGGGRASRSAPGSARPRSPTYAACHASRSCVRCSACAPGQHPHRPAVDRDARPLRLAAHAVDGS